MSPAELWMWGCALALVASAGWLLGYIDGTRSKGRGRK
jgi:hypothetical protein